MHINKPSIAFIFLWAFANMLHGQSLDDTRVWTQKSQVYHDSSLTVFIEFSYPDGNHCEDMNAPAQFRFSALGNRKNDIKSIPIAFDFINCDGKAESRYVSLDLVLIGHKRIDFRDSYYFLGKEAFNVRLEEPPRPSKPIDTPVEENQDLAPQPPVKPEPPSPNVPY